MAKNIKLDKKSNEEKKLLADFRKLRADLKERVNLYQSFPQEKKSLWLSKDPLMAELIDFAQKLTGGKDDN